MIRVSHHRVEAFLDRETSGSLDLREGDFAIARSMLRLSKSRSVTLTA
jgi:hypothetical protein